MLRVALVSVLVLAVPLGAIPLVTSLDGDGPGDDPLSMPMPEEGEPLGIDGSAMPGPVGWFVVPVTANVDGWVEIEAVASFVADETRPAGAAFVIATEDPRHAPGHPLARQAWETVRVTHEGQAVGCCSAFVEGLQDEDPWELREYAFGPVGPDTPVYVGLVGVGWSDQSELTITLRPYADPREDAIELTAGAPASAEKAELVDLHEEAYRQGTTARLGDTALVGGPSDVTLTREIEHAGFLALESWVDGAAQGLVTVELPNGTRLDNAPGRHVWQNVQALTTPGTLTLLVEDIEVASPLVWTSDAESGHFEAHALLADIEVPYASLRAWSASTNSLGELRERGGTVLEVDASHLPGPTGWFVVPVHLGEEGAVEVAFEINLTTPSTGMKAAAPVFAASDGGWLDLWPNLAGGAPLVAASADGHTVGCCDALGAYGMWTMGATGSSGFYLGTGQVAYVGIAAVGWSGEDDLRILLRSDAPGLSLGKVRSGDNVVAMDLFHEADEAGTNARLFGSFTVGEPGDVERTWTAHDNAMVSGHYWITGDVRGKLALELPGGRSHDNGDGRNVEGGFVGALGSGDVDLSFTDVERPQPIGVLGSDPGYGYATVLFADIDLPLSSFHEWSQPTEE